MRRKDKVIASLSGVLLLGFLFRMSELGTPSLWLDEIHSYERASQASWAATHQMLIVAGHAPLYEAVLLHQWLKIGISEFILRFPSVAFGILNIAITYTLGKAVFGTKVGIMGAAIQALSPLHVYYSQEARMYTLASLLTATGAYFFVKAYHSEAPPNARKHWAGYVLCGTLGLYTHYLTALVPLVLSAFAVVSRLASGKERTLPSILLSDGLMGLAFAPWVPTLRLQLQRPRLPWVPPFRVERMLDILTRFFLNKQALGQAYPFLALSVGLILATGILTTYLGRRNNSHLHSREKHTLIAAYAVGPMLLMVVVSLFKSVIVDRYFLILVPPVSILFGLGIVHLARFRAALPLIVALAAATTISSYRVASTDWKEDWKGVSKHIDGNSRSGDIIVLIPATLRPPFAHYYDGPLPIHNVAGDLTQRRDVEREFEKLASFARFWVIQAERFDVSRKIKEYLLMEYGQNLLSCQEFGGFYGVDVCLYTSNPSQ